MRALLGGIALLALSGAGIGTCDMPAPTPAPAPAPSAQPNALPCLPVVSGCGCAYQCGRAMKKTDVGWMISHDLQDSRLDEAEVARWCFDALGRGAPSAVAPANATRCLDVFYDRSACGGECIPRTEFLSCRDTGVRCAR